MKNAILPPGALFIVFIVICVLMMAEAGAAFLIKENTEATAGVSCVVNAVHPRGDYVRLDLGCGDQKAYTENAKAVASYVSTPGPLTCTIYKSGSATCEPRKK